MSVRRAPPGAPSQATFRKRLWERDAGVCCRCGAAVGQDFHADHRVPLWKVAHMPDSERAWYFDPDNNGDSLCTDCHKRKSGKERGEQAHYERMTNGPKPKRHRWPTRKLQSRGFRK